MGRDKEGCIQNMPEGRNFLVRVLGKLNDAKSVYSPWKKAVTLSPETRDKDLGNLDPMNMPRMNCNNCPCPCCCADWAEYCLVVVSCLFFLRMPLLPCQQQSEATCPFGGASTLLEGSGVGAAVAITRSPGLQAPVQDTAWFAAQVLGIPE